MRVFMSSVCAERFHSEEIQALGSLDAQGRGWKGRLEAIMRIQVPARFDDPPASQPKRRD